MLASMRRNHNYFVYILASKSRTLYIGVTKNLLVRLLEHRNRVLGGFTKRYEINRLVYFERYQYIRNAIAREKELKGWLRAKKIALVEKENPTWEDLSIEIFASPEGKQILRFTQDDKNKGR